MFDWKEREKQVERWEIKWMNDWIDSWVEGWIVMNLRTWDRRKQDKTRSKCFDLFAKTI